MRCVVVAFAVLLTCHGDVVAVAAAQPCRAVRHSELEKLLPVLAGFGRNQPRGETDDAEAVARTTVDYEAKAARISIELMDTCRNPDMLSQLREFLATGAPATPGTTMRSIAIRGFAAYEEWTAESRHGEIHVLVADRFTVKVTGQLVESLKVIEGAAEAIDLPTLAALK